MKEQKKIQPRTAITLFSKYYEEAMQNDYIQKPVSWALYKTWREINAQEITKKELAAERGLNNEKM